MVLFGAGGKNARLLGTAVLVFTFIAGALAGAAAIRVLSAEKAPKERAERMAPPMRGGPRKLLQDEKFVAELGLSDAQRAQIKTILDRRDVEAGKLWQSFEPQLHAFGQKVREDLAQVLTPEQQTKLDAAVEQRRAAWKKQRHNCKEKEK